MPIFRDINDSDTLLIVFPALGGTLLPGNSFYAKAGLAACSKIVIIDESKRKTLGGVSPDYSSFFDVLDYLRNEIRSISPKKIFILGMSAGGFPSILYGHLLQVDRVVAFSPFTYLCRKIGMEVKDPGVFIYNDSLENIEILPDCIKKYLDLKETLKVWNGKTKYSIHVSSTQLLDLRRAKYLLNSPGVDIVVHDIDKHVVAYELLNKFDFVKYFMDDDCHETRGDIERIIKDQEKVTDCLFYYYFGNFLKKRGELEGARESQEKAIALDASIPGPHVQLSHIHNQRGNIGQAILEIREAIAIQDDNPRWRHHLGNLLKKSGDLEGAKEAQEMAIALDASIPGPHVQLSHIHHQLGNTGQAILEIQEAIAIQDDNPRWWHHLGYLLKKSGDLEGAKEAQEMAIALDASIPGPHVQLSHIHHQLGNTGQAILEIQEAIAIQDGNPRWWHHLGNLLKKSGDLEGAKTAQVKAIALDASIPGPHVQLSHIHNQLGNTGQAIREIQEAIALKDDNPKWHQYLGNLLKKSGDLEEVKEAQEKVRAFQL